MQNTAFLTHAHATLQHLTDRLDIAVETGALEDVLLTSDMLTIQTVTGRTFVVSLHASTHQMWLASPVSGGLHFSYNETVCDFTLANGRTIRQILQHDLLESGVTIML